MQLKNHLKQNYLIIAVVFYGLFLALIRLKGSLQGDEAIYAQVAKETLAKGNWLEFYWRGEIWLEKPPLYLWLVMLVKKYITQEEAGLRMINGFFLTAAMLAAYFFTQKISNQKITAFLSAVIIGSIPIFIKHSRAVMTDAALTFFILGALYFGFLAENKHKKHLIHFWIFCALGILVKNFLGFYAVIIYLIYLIALKKLKLIISGYSLIGFLIFLLITLPWHVIMYLKFDKIFLNQYFLYHFLERSEYSIIHSPWDEVPLAYLKILFSHYGVWSVILAALLIYLLLFYQKLIKHFRESEKRGLILALIWFFTVFISFSLAKTKSPHYILPLVPSMALTISIIINGLIKSRPRDIIIFCGLALLNFTPFYYLNASDFGESNILFPAVFLKFSKIFGLAGYAVLYWGLGLFFLLLIGLYKLIEKNKAGFEYLVLFMVVLNLLVPFYPERGAAEKKLAEAVNQKFNQKPLNIYLDDPKLITNTLLYYLPLGSDVERYQRNQVEFLSDIDLSKHKDYCLVSSKVDQRVFIPCLAKESLEPPGWQCNYCLD
ncbi:MAG: phospholipid carrier-dependent glycosyltransferase [Candidatus Moranbacteria bacterium]|nr:phospholipid carrier-dependent glycosyltransferase [Candidatus Moranbacteria bacterium]